jgi:two-component system CheB/CheR fusion protein
MQVSSATKSLSKLNAATALRGVKVLVVDDDWFVRDLIGTLLNHQQADVRVVDSVFTAWNALMAEPFDLLVSDLQMPGLDGYDLITRVRASPVERIRSVAAIAVSGLSLEADRLHSMAIGFDGHLAKPFRADALFDIIRRALEERSSERSKACSSNSCSHSLPSP